MIYQLIYSSWAKHEFVLRDLVHLLEHSRQNNKKCSVTGILLYRERHFFQLLEGDEEAVSSIMEKVEKDARHEGISYLYRETTPAPRLFPNWSMGFPHLKYLDIVGWEGLADHNLEATMAHLDAQPDSVPGRLLKTIIFKNKFCYNDLAKETYCEKSDNIEQNHTYKQTTHSIKVLIMGPVGAGKTTYISTLSQVPVVSTEELSTQEIGKLFTTVAFDYGSFVVDDFQIHLFGTPGQERFDFMWEVLCENSMGLILLLNGSKVSDFSQARKALDFMLSRIAIPYIIGVTHQDLPKSWNLEDISRYFEVPIGQVVGLDPRNKKHALKTIQILCGIVQSESDN
jgi:small GTP-binding protein